METTEDWVCHGLDRHIPGLLKPRPRRARSELRDPLDSLMRPGFVVLCNVGQNGGAKVVLGQKKEVVQALPLQASHEPLNVRSRVGGTVGDRHSLDSQDLSQPQVQGTSIRLARSSPPKLAEDPIVVVDKESGPGAEGGRLPDPLLQPGQGRRCGPHPTGDSRTRFDESD